MGYTRIIHLIGYLGQSQFIIAYQFFHTLNALHNEITFDGEPRHLTKQFAQSAIVTVQQLCQIDAQIKGFVALMMAHQRDDGCLHALNHLLSLVVEQFKPQGL